MQYTFKPTFFLAAFCLILFGVFLSLGIWQVNRTAEKKQLQQLIEQRSEQAPVSLNQETTPALFPHSKAEAKGIYRPSEQFLLDNIIQGGKPGFYVITPFEIEGTELTILVNRGWIAQGKTRQQLPTIATDTKSHTIQGTLSAPRSKPVVLGNIDSPISDTPPLWYYMDVEHFEKTVGYTVLPLVILLPPSPESPLIRQWPTFNANEGMHIGYAIQWFVFALFVLIAFLSISIKKTTGSEHE